MDRNLRPVGNSGQSQGARSERPASLTGHDDIPAYNDLFIWPLQFSFGRPTILTMGISKKNGLKNAAKYLITFEESLASYYHDASLYCQEYPDFWNNASTAKITRANLYASMLQDIERHWINYELIHEVTGPFINLIKRIESEKKRLQEGRYSQTSIIQFIREIELAPVKTQVLPSIKGTTEAFSKIALILDQIQDQQVRLMEGFLNDNARCNKPQGPKNSSPSSLSGPPQVCRP